MPMKTWTIKYQYEGAVIEVVAKAGEDNVRHLGHGLREITHEILNSFRELRGWQDEPGELSPFTTHSIHLGTETEKDWHYPADVSAWQADTKDLLARLHALPQPLNNNQVKQFGQECEALGNKHRPIKDCRQPRPEVAHA